MERRDEDRPVHALRHRLAQDRLDRRDLDGKPRLIAGGIRVTDPAIDLPVLCALISSLEDVVIPAAHCFAGEVGLSGEIRSVTRLEQRILEAERLGFHKIYLSKFHAKSLDFKPKHIEIFPVGDISQLYDSMFV